MPAHNIIVLDHFFNLKMKSSRIGKLNDLTHFFDNLVVAYFFGTPNLDGHLCKNFLLSIFSLFLVFNHDLSYKLILPTP